MENGPEHPPAPPEITRLLLSMRLQDPDAAEKLFSLIYDELRAIARRRLGSRTPGQTLDTAGLVHEAYLKLFDQTSLEWRDRKHFYSVVAMAMHQIIVDHARRRLAGKRGGGQPPVDIDRADPPAEEGAEQILAVHDALQHLGALDGRLARLVELRFFSGFSVEEIAEILEVSPRTVKRDWRKARAILFATLRPSPEP